MANAGDVVSMLMFEQVQLQQPVACSVCGCSMPARWWSARVDGDLVCSASCAAERNDGDVKVQAERLEAEARELEAEIRGLKAEAKALRDEAATLRKRWRHASGGVVGRLC